ncbi:MAG: carboxypeptidase-like regulatory domain-containing protein [Flavobacteriaceae bacterium]
MHRLRIIILTIFSLTLSLTSFAQTKELKGQILSNADRSPMMGSHIINLNSVRGATTDDDGQFSIETQVNDTIMVSYVGFQTIKLKITEDLLKGNELEIVLYERTESLDETVVNSHDLIGVLEIDIKSSPRNEYNRIHIDGLPQLYEIGAPKSSKFKSPIDAVFNPVDYMYNMFGKKPKQLDKLKTLRKEDEMRDILADKYDRELLLEYLSMNSVQLDRLLDDCKYSDYFIAEASDLQLLEALLECYENYKAIQTGSINRDALPEN